MSNNTGIMVTGSGRSRGPRARDLDASLHPDVEVVPAEEERHREQAKSKAKIPETFFTKSPEGIPGLPGVDVNSSVLLGFLSAAEIVVSDSDECKVLSSIKISYLMGDRVYLEAAGGDMWTVVAIEASETGEDGFEAIVPLRHARNAVNANNVNYKQIRIGPSPRDLCLGGTLVPYSGRSSEYPVKPVFRDWETRAVVPAAYFEEIQDRIIPASDVTEENLRGVLLDYDIVDVDGESRIICTAVATDGKRMHTICLPQMRIDPIGGGVLPPAIVVTEKFFKYLAAVADREWTALEVSEGQVIARGEDYIVVAEARMRGNSNENIDNWRAVDVNYGGFWTADQKDLKALTSSALEVGDGSEVRLRIDSRMEQLELHAWGEGGKFKDSIPVKRFGGPPSVDVTIDGGYLADAVFACKSGLIRLGFSDDVSKQRSSAVVIRGEDELFKAVIMPIQG